MKRGAGRGLPAGRKDIGSRGVCSRGISHPMWRPGLFGPQMAAGLSVWPCAISGEGQKARKADASLSTTPRIRSWAHVCRFVRPSICPSPSSAAAISVVVLRSSNIYLVMSVRSWQSQPSGRAAGSCKKKKKKKLAPIPVFLFCLFLA